MKNSQRYEIITQINELLIKLIEEDAAHELPTPSTSLTEAPLEMLTVKECAALVSGLTEHTVRQLVAQDKIAYVRAGIGRNGKILISKISLLKYLGIAG